LFEDISAYLSQLDEFLKSFDAEETKAFFPHKEILPYLTRNSKIPHKDWFSNDMSNQNMEFTDYLKMQIKFVKWFSIMANAFYL
jgi:hypothetical protein